MSSTVFPLCTKDGYCISVQTRTKQQMREVYTIIQLNRYFYLSWNTGALRQSRPLLLAPDFTKLFSRGASNEGRQADGLWTENCFFCQNRTHWHSPLFTFSGTWSTATRETEFSMFFNILHTSHLNNIRDVNSRAWRSFTNSWWCNSFCIKHCSRVPLTALLSSTTFSRHDVRSSSTGLASTPIAPQSSNSELCRTASAAATAVFNMLIPVSEKKLLCVNRGWRKKSCKLVSAPFFFAWSLANPSRDTAKSRMHRWRTPHHQCCQLKDLEATY